MSYEIRTDQKLLDRLTRAGNVSHEILRKQRVSFIYGSLPKDSTITKQQIEEALAKVEGEAAA